MSDPKISIVVPSYNQAQFLDETLRSILDQRYPHLEVIVIDGGSTDGSVELIKKYESQLTYWVSEPDGGQAAAVGKGFDHASGEILAFLNSDDVYLPGALRHVADCMCAKPDRDWIAGDCIRFSAESSHPPMITAVPTSRALWIDHCPIFQPATFWTRRAYDKIGRYPDRVRYSHDWDFWLLLVFAGVHCDHLKRPLAGFRVHGTSATHTLQEKIAVEDEFLRRDFSDRLEPREKRALVIFRKRMLSGRMMQEAGELVRSGERRKGKELLIRAASTYPLSLAGRAARDCISALIRR